MSEMVTSKNYVIVGREQEGLAGVLRGFLNARLSKIFGEYHRTGGTSGDLWSETAEFEVYHPDSDGWVHVYTVIDDTTSGFALLISVIFSLPADSPVHKTVATFLQEHDFVTSHASFKARPFGCKSFASYLDEPYFPSTKTPFKAK